MITPHFYLRDPGSKKPTPIVLHCNAKTRIKVSTGISINPALWSKSKEKVSSKHPHSETLNRTLDKLKARFIEEYYSMINSLGYINNTKLKENISNTSIEKTLLYDIFSDHIENMKTSGKYRAKSANSYISAQKHIEAYEAKNGKIDIRHINNHWQKIQDYFLSAEHNGKGYSTNYINKMISRMLTVLRAYTKDKPELFALVSTLSIDSRREETTAIYLNQEEIEKFYNIDLSENKRLEKARDLFITGAVTGLRYSDFVRLSRNNIREIEGMYFLDWLTHKTSERVIIPADKKLIDLLDKYGGKMPHLSDQKLRDYLKEIGQLSGFLDDKVNDIITRSGKKVSEMVPRWKLLQTHTARRSFATNKYLAGFDLLSIMKMTGHKSQKSFLSYIRVTDEQNAILVARKMASDEKAKMFTAGSSIKYILSNKNKLELSPDEEKALVCVLEKIQSIV